MKIIFSQDNLIIMLSKSWNSINEDIGEIIDISLGYILNLQTMSL